MIQRWQIKNWLVAHPWTVGIVLVLLIAFAIGGGSWWTARKYDKGRLKYEADSKAWATERPALIARAEESEKRERAKDMEAAAWKAAAESGRKIDEETAQKIEEVAKEAANAEANAQIVIDCRSRADRLCSLFKSGDSRFNCNVIYDECK